jgi:aminoglycoside phosphotransferase (APT) family kinase protein
VKEPGRLLAAGRDADIFEYGPKLVLRRARDRRQMAGEARTMEYLHSQGYPVPAVDSISDDGCDLVIERIEGRSMLEVLSRTPWRVRHQAAVLADLHHRLHEVTPPDFLPRSSVRTGSRILHMDLHPMNVMIGPKGPVVIDWTGAAVGDPDVDVALAWVLMAAGQIQAGPAIAILLGIGRSLLVNGFLRHFDRDQVSACLRDVVTAKSLDSHMSEQEISAMWRLVDLAENQA